MATIADGEPLSDFDFHELLARRIEASRGSGLTRQDIYDAARAALQRQAVLQRPYLGIEQIRRHLASLESAISRLEAEFAKNDEARRGTRLETRFGPAGAADRLERSEDASDVGSGVSADIGGSHERLRPGADGMANESCGNEAEVSPADEPPEKGSDFDRPYRELIMPPARYLRHRDAAIYDIDLITPETASRQADPPPPPVAKRILASTAFLVQLTIASLAGVTLYAFLAGQGIPGVGFGRGDPSTSTAVPAPAVSTRITPRPRPEVTRGITEKVVIGCGNLYITVNYDDKGICEVFTNLGRAGGCPSQSEATSRLISTALRSGLEVDAIIEQLKGIRCHSTLRQRGVNKNIKVLSCPDAIGRVLDKVAKLCREGEQIGLPVEQGRASTFVSVPEEPANGDDDVIAEENGVSNLINSPCPECGGAMEHEGGCVVCRGCGYSRCG